MADWLFLYKAQVQDYRRQIFQLFYQQQIMLNQQIFMQQQQTVNALISQDEGLS